MFSAVEEQEVLSAPEFIAQLQDVTTTDGGKVKFQVTVTGQPQPEVTWLKDDNQVEESEEFIITTEGDVVSLTIPDVYPEDAGRYTAVAKNKLGTVTTTAVLCVEGRGSNFLCHLFSRSRLF